MGVLSLGSFFPSQLSHYFIASFILLCVWLFRPTSKGDEVDVPLYKASRTKWMFEADTLIRDSYSKVDIYPWKHLASLNAC